MKKSRSIVPPHLQVPLTLAMGVIFIIVLYMRFGGGASAPPAARSASAASTAAPAGATAELVTQLKEGAAALNVAAAGRTRAVPELPPLPRNPFFPADLAHEQLIEEIPAAEEAPGPVEAPPPAPEPPPLPVVVREPLPSLSAVMLHAGGGMAILDGQYVRAGGKIGSYKVLRIEEKRVLLSDGNAQEWVELKVPGRVGTAQ